jgi:hypothetical protein
MRDRRRSPPFLLTTEWDPTKPIASFSTGAWIAQAGRLARWPVRARDAGEGAREESRYRLVEPSNGPALLYHDPDADARFFWQRRCILFSGKWPTHELGRCSSQQSLGAETVSPCQPPRRSPRGTNSGVHSVDLRFPPCARGQARGGAVVRAHAWNSHRDLCGTPAIPAPRTRKVGLTLPLLRIPRLPSRFPCSWLSAICLLGVRTVGRVCGKLDAGPAEDRRPLMAQRVNGSLTPL